MHRFSQTYTTFVVLLSQRRNKIMDFQSPFIAHRGMSRCLQSGWAFILGNMWKLLSVSCPILLIAAIAGALIGNFDAQLLQSLRGGLVLLAIMLLLSLLFLFNLSMHLRRYHTSGQLSLRLSFQLLRHESGATLSSMWRALKRMFASDSIGGLFGLLFVGGLTALLLSAIALLPLWLHSSIQQAANAALAINDPADLPSYFTPLGWFYGAIFTVFTLCFQLLLLLPLAFYAGRSKA